MENWRHSHPPRYKNNQKLMKTIQICWLGTYCSMFLFTSFCACNFVFFLCFKVPNLFYHLGVYGRARPHNSPLDPNLFAHLRDPEVPPIDVSQGMRLELKNMGTFFIPRDIYYKIRIYRVELFILR